MENSNINDNVYIIDFVDLYKIIKTNFLKSIIFTVIAAIFTTIIVLSLPQYYTANVKLTPEYGSKQSGNLGSLGNAAAMFGININSNNNYDAIAPAFYPEIIASSDFIIPLMEVEVETIDGTFKGTYSKYITEAKKYPWWKNVIKKISPKHKKNDFKKNEINPFMMSREENSLIKAISASIQCTVEKKMNTIEIKTTAQDPLVAATMANAVKEKLQEFITKYRTGKVKRDYEYSLRFFETAHNDYIAAQLAYAEYADKHQGVSRQAYKIEQERLQGEMQLAYNMYNAASQQKIVAAAKLQEETPIFTEIQKASVPVYPTGPKRKSTIIIITFLAFSFCNALFLILHNIRKRQTYVQE